MRYSYGLILGTLLFFLLYKILRFDALGYSFNDMYAFLQMSYSWMDGRPFMYDNIWGYHHRIHNYYTVLLWGPLCYYFGAKGLFFVQTVLLLLAYWLTNRQLIRAGVPDWAQIALVGVILLGPVSFWLNDHPTIGWHSELTYLPAALFWAVGLGQKSEGRKEAGNGFWLVLAGAFLVLIREEGAILALIIHGSAVALAYFKRSGEMRSKLHPLLGLLIGPSRQTGRFWLAVLGWSVVFVAGMVWIAAKNNFAAPRLQNALYLLETHMGERLFRWQLFVLLVKSLALLLPVVVLLELFTRALKPRLKTAVRTVWLVGVTALTILNIVQSAYYIDQPLFYLVALSWPPRFVLIWGFSAAFLLLVVGTFAHDLRPVSVRKMVWSTAFLWLIQLPLLKETRTDLPGLAEWKAAFMGPPGANMDARFLQEKERAVMRRLAASLPPHSNVFAFDYIMPYFHKQYGIWPTGNQWQPADVAILSRPDFQHLRDRLNTLLPVPIDSVQLPNYTIYYRPAFAPFVKSATEK